MKYFILFLASFISISSQARVPWAYVCSKLFFDRTHIPTVVMESDPNVVTYQSTYVYHSNQVAAGTPVASLMKQPKIAVSQID